MSLNWEQLKVQELNWEFFKFMGGISKMIEVREGFLKFQKKKKLWGGLATP